MADLVQLATKYMGTPYVWGGESMEEGGMDCSGFIFNVLRDAGVTTERLTAQGYRSYGTPVSKADIQPGDLVFFGSQSNATHIGMYIGNGQIIHSAGGSKNTKSNPGKGVSIVSLDHRSDLIDIRRVGSGTAFGSASGSGLKNLAIVVILVVVCIVGVMLVMLAQI